MQLGFKIVAVFATLFGLYVGVTRAITQHKIDGYVRTIKVLKQEKANIVAKFADYKFSCEQKLTIAKKKRKTDVEVEKINSIDLEPGLHTLSF